MRSGARRRRVQQDVVAGHAHDALETLLAGLDGDRVDDAVADLHAPAPAVPLVRHEPLVGRQEGRHHRRTPPEPDAHPVRPHHVRERKGLRRREEHAEGMA